MSLSLLKNHLKTTLKTRMERIFGTDIRRPLPSDITYQELHPVHEDDAFATGLITIEGGQYVYEEIEERGQIGHTGRLFRANGKPLIDTATAGITIARRKWYGGLPLRKARKLKPQNPMVLGGTTLLLSTLDISNEFFHYIFDVVINLALLQETDNLRRFDTIVIPSIDRKWKAYFLEKFGLPPEKLMTLHEHDCIKCARLVTPVRPYGANWLPSWAGAYAKNHLALKEDRDDNYPRKLYVSRADVDRRQVVNEEELVNPLKDLGFVIITLADKPIEDQERLFRNADIVIGPHGAGFAHMFNMDPGGTIVEFSPWNRIKPALPRLAAQLGLSHYHIHAEKAGATSNMRVEPEQLIAFLKSLEK